MRKTHGFFYSENIHQFKKIFFPNSNLPIQTRQGAAGEETEKKTKDFYLLKRLTRFLKPYKF